MSKSGRTPKKKSKSKPRLVPTGRFYDGVEIMRLEDAAPTERQYVGSKARLANTKKKTGLRRRGKSR